MFKFGDNFRQSDIQSIWVLFVDVNQSTIPQGTHDMYDYEIDVWFCHFCRANCCNFILLEIPCHLAAVFFLHVDWPPVALQCLPPYPPKISQREFIMV